jgi:hypothetical protein
MAARSSQSNSNAMLYSLITFVGLFVIATVCAVIFYVKSEEYRTQLETLRTDTDRIATAAERAAMGRIVGKSESGKSYMAKMQSLLDTLYQAITGLEPSAEVPADVKVNTAIMQINNAIAALGSDANPALGAQGIALVNMIKDLKEKLEGNRTQVAQLGDALSALQDEFDMLQTQMQQRQNLFLNELETSQSLIDQIRAEYNALREQMDKATEEQIATYRERLENEQARLRARQLELQELEQKLQETESMLQEALAKLEGIKPRPDVEVAAYRPDAKIIRVDLQNELVTLDIGTKDRVYPGLTFAIYQSNVPIPEDGKGKAEIEVFQVGQQVSVARIVTWDKRNPVVPDDLVVNLIWDPKMNNKFVIVGDFDTTGDGRIDPKGVDHVKDLIERWGGIIQDDITIDTDFVIVGIEPTIPERPTADELDADPTAFQRYENAMQRARKYNEMLTKAEKLRVPVFNYERFLYLIGYNTLAARMGIN